MAVTQRSYITAFITMCLMGYGVPAQQCGSETSIYGMMLKEHVFKKIGISNTDGPAFDCLEACNDDIRCQSLNYVISQEMCELNNRTKEARPEDFVANLDRYYYRRYKNRVALGSIPELPAESCKEIKASEGVETVSGIYWFHSIKAGESVRAYCDMDTEDVDECSASVDVCNANAVCENTRGSYRCHCKDGYTGNGCTEPLLTVTSSCGNLLLEQTSTSGIILSTNNSDYNYNSNSDYYYDNDMDCQWNLVSTTNLELTFLTFSTQLDADYLYVYDGGSPSSPLIGTFSGTTLPTPITSSSNKLHIRFTSDSSSTSRGFRATYRAITDGNIRLMNSETPLTGRVEIFYNGQWGTVCGDGWDIDDTNVACKQLGYPQATQAFKSASHGQGSGPIWMADVACSGSESFLYECSHGGWGNSDCTHNNDASVQCSYGSSPVRLVNGGASHGRVEVYYNDTWGTVCDDYWHVSDPNVVCRQLGYSGALSAPCCTAYGEGSDPIWLDDVQCNGTETSLLDCPHDEWGKENCEHKEDASMVCY